MLKPVGYQIDTVRWDGKLAEFIREQEGVDEYIDFFIRRKTFSFFELLKNGRRITVFPYLPISVGKAGSLSAIAQAIPVLRSTHLLVPADMKAAFESLSASHNAFILHLPFIVRRLKLFRVNVNPFIDLKTFDPLQFAQQRASLIKQKEWAKRFELVFRDFNGQEDGDLLVQHLRHKVSRFGFSSQNVRKWKILSRLPRDLLRFKLAVLHSRSNGRVVASMLLRNDSNNELHALSSAFDDRFARFSPGNCLMFLTVCHAKQDGTAGKVWLGIVKEKDPRLSYKLAWCHEFRTTYLVGMH
ncbi:MAG: GNAT family N-acetyltransferase [Candidatus Omnitrophica bacterium]|nr:GNAT family N-acetyltransferase [Candidatus Omnitrophota bacterium]